MDAIDAPAPLPCPFCGAPAEISHSIGNAWRVGCTTGAGRGAWCRGSTPMLAVGKKTLADAVEAWNRRTPAQGSPQEGEPLPPHLLPFHDEPCWKQRDDLVREVLELKAEVERLKAAPQEAVPAAPGARPRSVASVLEGIREDLHILAARMSGDGQNYWADEVRLFSCGIDPDVLIQEGPSLDMEAEHKAFEHWMSDEGRHPRATERGRDGRYLLAHTAFCWTVWQARASIGRAAQ